MELVEAEGNDVAYATSLLEESDLPTDLDGTALYVARVDGERVGCGGLELYGTDGLFRSLAVDSAFRGAGHGRAITEGLCTKTVNRGVTEIYLLTTTAEEFFEKQGFERVGRERVPDAIHETKQFSTLCPESAIPMRRTP